MGRVVDKTGKRYGRLTIIEFAYRDLDSRTYWRCLCDCGKETVVFGGSLTSGSTKSCGCIGRSTSLGPIIHGMRYTSEYKSWCSMKGRCSNPNFTDYEHYGGRGIKVCERWCESFENFFEDMGLKPGPGYAIHRIDNDGDYYLGNCKWLSQSENAATSWRDRRKVEFA